MSSMDDLTTRITFALNHAERLAFAARAVAANARTPSPEEDPGDWSHSGSGISAARPIILTREYDLEPELGEHITHWDPKAVLGLIAAHREILEWAETMINRYKDEHRNQAWDETHAAFSGAARIMLTKLAKAHRIEAPE